MNHGHGRIWKTIIVVVLGLLSLGWGAFAHLDKKSCSKDICSMLNENVKVMRTEVNNKLDSIMDRL